MWIKMFCIYTFECYKNIFKHQLYNEQILNSKQFLSLYVHIKWTCLYIYLNEHKNNQCLSHQRIFFFVLSSYKKTIGPFFSTYNKCINLTIYIYLLMTIFLLKLSWKYRKKRNVYLYIKYLFFLFCFNFWTFSRSCFFLLSKVNYHHYVYHNFTCR